jgi:hypothetical protein
MSYSALTSFGLVLCFLEACFGAMILWGLCLSANLLLGGSIERKTRGIARRRLLDELAAYEKAKAANKDPEAELPRVETNPYAIPAVVPEQAVVPHEPIEQPVPVPRFGKGFFICLSASIVQLLVRWLLVLALIFTGSSLNVTPNQVLRSSLNHFSPTTYVASTLIRFLVLAVLLKYFLPTKWWIAILISAIFVGTFVAAIFLFVALIG